jgi:hypothetical protein
VPAGETQASSAAREKKLKKIAFFLQKSIANSKKVRIFAT